MCLFLNLQDIQPAKLGNIRLDIGYLKGKKKILTASSNLVLTTFL